ncbi:MAG TPA: hypothetical protein VGK04_01695 [Thermoanaerobaculia bacterium]
MNHPNVCQLFDIGDSEGQPFLVMELLEGESLSDRLARGALPLTEAVRFTLAILTALEALQRFPYLTREASRLRTGARDHAGLARSRHTNHASGAIAAADSLGHDPRYEEALAAVDPDRDFGDSAFIYETMGEMDEVAAVFENRTRRLQAAGSRGDSIGFQIFAAFRAAIERRRNDIALQRIDNAVDGGFFCYPFFMRDPWLDPLRGDARLADALRRAEALMRDAQHAFEMHRGSRVLGVGVLR